MGSSPAVLVYTREYLTDRLGAPHVTIISIAHSQREDVGSYSLALNMLYDASTDNPRW